MSIIVAPATLFQPGTPVTEDVYGDSDGTLRGSARHQSFVFTADGDDTFGDAATLAGSAIGGRDSFTVEGEGYIYGDANSLEGSARGGADSIEARQIDTPSDVDVLYAYGDAFLMHDRALGGNDTI